jgi:anhydro-N-acetylmuramic acid kinase
VTTIAPEGILAAGLMSGTSLDGLHAALVRIREPLPGRPEVELVRFLTLEYGPDDRGRIGGVISEGGAREIAQLHHDLGAWSAELVAALISEAGLEPSQVAFVASHGQTIWHEPPAATLQVGAAAVIAERLGIPVIADFRARDVAAGGQGAPLVPRADRLLFSRPDGPRVLLNLGGIANLSAVPAAGSDAPLLAFDAGPGVMVMDACVRQLVPGHRFDAGGRLALAGRVLEEVVDEMLRMPFFDTPPPRSTGREAFGEQFASRFVARCMTLSERAEDVVATATDLTAQAIGRSARFIPAELAPLDVVRSGGGARNPALAAAVERHWPGPEHRSFDDLYFDGSAKEAVAFALLGYLTWTMRPGNEPGATGAAGPRLLGSVTPP